MSDTHPQDRPLDWMINSRIKGLTALIVGAGSGVGEATANAVYPDSRNRWSHVELLDEGFEPHAVARMWLHGLEPNLFVDITDVIDLKVQALLSHQSQVGERDGVSELIRNWGASNATLAGWGSDRFAEAFREIDTR